MPCRDGERLGRREDAAVESEHAGAKALIGELQAIRLGAKLDQKFAALKTAITEPVQKEKSTLFPKTRKAQQVDTLSLGRPMKERSDASRPRWSRPVFAARRARLA